MPDTPRHPSFSFHIEDRDHASRTVPASVLINILQRAQHAFELIGVQIEGRNIKLRARIPAAISRRFQLICELPQAGSYALPVTVGAGGELFDAQQAWAAFDVFCEAARGVAVQDTARVSAALPDPSVRRRVLESFRGMAPSAEARWTLSLHNETGQSFASLDAASIRFVDEALVPEEQREAAKVVTGELKSIDFAEHKVTIIYPPTSKELACIYEEDIEELLYERRRDLIQVTGRVLLDDQGDPKQIIDVTDIRDLDLSELTLDTVQHGGAGLNATPALTLQPVLDETKQLLCIEDEALGIDVYATTREALLAELHEQVAMLWHEYALAPDGDLDAAARRLKQALLARFVPAADAP